MVVLKFGGTSVADAQPIVRAAEIVAKAHGRRVVVVSALAGVTDRLLQIVEFATSGRLESALALVGRVRQRHCDLIQSLLPIGPGKPGPYVGPGLGRASIDPEYVGPGLGRASTDPEYAGPGLGRASIDPEYVEHRLGRASTDPAAHLASVHDVCDELEAIVRAAAVLRDVSPRTRDTVCAAGEVMSSRIVAAAFERLGIPAAWVDARDVLVTDGHHGEAAPDMRETAARAALHVAPLLDAGTVPVIGGFVGATLEGATTTLGRGGSDYSAAILGACLGAREIQIWTDVDGLLAADPRIVADPHQVPQLTFAEARELAYFGAKVLHPSTLEPAVERGIPVRILNARRPEGAGTLVNGSTSRALHVPAALACKRSIAVVEAVPRDRQRPATFVREVFQAFEDARLHPCVSTVSDAVVVAAFDDEARARAAAAALADAANVTVRGELALLAAVGEGLGSAPGLTANLLSALDGLAVHAVAQPPAGRSITMLVDDADVADAMQRVYDQFFPAEAARHAEQQPLYAAGVRAS